MYKYLPLAKVQAALCGCQTQQKTNIQGKVFTAALAKAGTASERAARHGPARGRLARRTWPAATLPGKWLIYSTRQSALACTDNLA